MKIEFCNVEVFEEFFSRSMKFKNSANYKNIFIKFDSSQEVL